MDLATHSRRATQLLLLVVLGAGGPVLAQDAGTCPPPPPAALTAQQLQEGAARAQDRGYLWRVTKDGHSSYLYGTIHMAKREWMFPGPRIVQALREIDTVALEIDPFDPQTRQRLVPGAAPRPAATEVPVSLTERIERRMAFECVPGATLKSLAPELQVMALTLLAGRRDGLELAYAIDPVIASIGRAAHKKVVPLETTQVQLEARRALSDGGRVASMEKALDELESGRAAALLSRLGAMWAAADTAELARYERTLAESSSETERALLKQAVEHRNAGLADGIDALHVGGSKVFAAIGFMHMIGTASLPGLLADKGYQVESIALGR